MADVDIMKEKLKFENFLREDSFDYEIKDEYLIPDTHPDVQRILTVSCKPRITKKELVGDKIILDGKIDYTVIYLAREDDVSINSIDYSQDFTTNIELKPGESMVNCDVNCNVEHIEASIMNERKILINGVINIECELYKDTDIEFVKDVQGNKNVQTLKETETINRIYADKDLELKGKSMIRVGMDKPQINKILNCVLKLHKKEIKLSDDKIYVGCYCKINILYKGDDPKEIFELEDDVYLSKDEMVEGVTPEMIAVGTFEIASNDLNLEEDELNEIRIVNNEFIVNVNVKIFSKDNIDLIKDAYCTDSFISLNKENYDIGMLKSSNNTETLVKHNIQLKDTDLKPSEIVSINSNVILTDKDLVNNNIIVEGILKVDILYKTTDDDEYLSDIKAEVPFSAMIEVDGIDDNMSPIIRVDIDNIDAYVEGNSISIKANLMLNGKLLYTLSKEFISNVIEDDAKKPEKKASVTIYVVQKGDNLWNIAKKYSTTVEDIKNINELEGDEIQIGDKLMIPGRAMF